jgi:hypothetical protein
VVINLANSGIAAMAKPIKRREFLAQSAGIVAIAFITSALLSVSFHKGPPQNVVGSDYHRQVILLWG